MSMENIRKNMLSPVTWKARDGRTMVRATVRYKNKFEKLGNNLSAKSKSVKEVKLYHRVKTRRVQKIKTIIEQKAEGLDKVRDITIKRKLIYTSAIQIDIPLSYLKILRDDPDIAEVIEDGETQILGCMEDHGDSYYRSGWDPNSEEWPSWAWYFLDNGEKAESVGKGEGANIMVVDTGVSWLHPDLAENVVLGTAKNFTTESSLYDGHGHGTHCAGIIAAIGHNSRGTRGLAYKANIHFCKVLTEGGRGQWTWFEAALDYCLSIADQIDVLSMSLGGYYEGSVLPNLFLQLKNAGVVCCCAAGNSGNLLGTGNNVGYPGKDPSALGIASVGPYADNEACDEKSSFSSTGDEVDFAAPGGRIWSTLGGGSEYGKGYICWSGTSMATPFAAGIFALLKIAYPNDTVDELVTLAKEACLNRTNDYQARHPDPDPAYVERDPWYGWGILRVVYLAILNDLTTDIKAAKPYKFSAQVSPAPGWQLYTDLKVGKVQSWSFQTDYSDSWKLLAEIKARKDASWSFNTKLNPLWMLPTFIEAKKPYEFSFTIMSDIDERKTYSPQVEFMLPSHDFPLRTLFLDWVTATGSPYIYDFNMWWARKYQVESLENARLYAEVVTDENPGGKEIVEEGWISAKVSEGNWATLNSDGYLLLGNFGTDTYKSIQLRVTVPAGHTTSGLAFIKLKITGALDQAFFGRGFVYTDGVLYSGRDEVYIDSFICRLYIVS